MKLRIKGDSIRLRLGRSEVDRLAAGGAVVESTTFDPMGRQRFEYRLVADRDADEVVAALEDNRLTVRVPAGRAAAWGRSDAIGIAVEQGIGDGKALRILIEKDLECLDGPPGESQADAFARPGGAACGPADRVAMPAEAGR